MTTATWTKEQIYEKVTTNQAWTERAILAIYARQTDVEQVTHATKELNGVGFNGLDAEIMSSFAEWILKRGHLTAKQLSLAQRKIGKYAGQLMKITGAN